MKFIQSACLALSLLTLYLFILCFFFFFFIRIFGIRCACVLCLYKLEHNLLFGCYLCVAVVSTRFIIEITIFILFSSIRLSRRSFVRSVVRSFIYQRRVAKTMEKSRNGNNNKKKREENREHTLRVDYNFFSLLLLLCDSPTVS